MPDSNLLEEHTCIDMRYSDLREEPVWMGLPYSDLLEERMYWEWVDGISDLWTIIGHAQSFPI